MNFKHIATAAALMAAGSAFANIAVNVPGAATNQGTGLVFIVTDTVNEKSFDYDTGIAFTQFSATSTNLEKDIAADANWASFYNAANAGNYVWSIVAGVNNGASTSAGKNALLTSVTKGFDTSVIPTSSGGNINTIAANLNNVVIDVNNRLSGSPSPLSYVASKANAEIAYVGNDGLKLDYHLIAGADFTTGNAIGTVASLLSLANTGGRGAGNVFTITGTTAAYFDGSKLYVGAIPAVPEPEAFGLALVGMLLAGAVARRRA